MSHGDKYLLICGPGRSGTSLIETLIHAYIEDVYCFNELAKSCRVGDLVSFCEKMKGRLIRGELVPKRITRTGERTTNTWRDGSAIVHSLPDKKVSTDVIVAHKSILGCPYELEEILESKMFKVIVVVRNPVYTIAAWSDPKHRDMNVYRVMDNDMHDWWKSHRIEWISDNPIERRAQIWEHEVGMFLKFMQHENIRFIRYKDLVSTTRSVIESIAYWLGKNIVEAPEIKFKRVENCNKEIRYPFVDFSWIRRAVDKLCISRKMFDYI